MVVNTKTVDNDIGPEYRLVDYIRYKAGLTGTKYMCREGGCGCCVVMVKTKNASGEETTKSVNSVRTIFVHIIVSFVKSHNDP